MQVCEEPFSPSGGLIDSLANDSSESFSRQVKAFGLSYVNVGNSFA